MKDQEPTNIEKNGDLKHLRKDGFYPGRFEGDRPVYGSVTTICDTTIYKPFLEKWKIAQGIVAVRTHPDWSDEQIGRYLKDQQTRSMERGTRVHGYVEDYLNGREVVPWEGEEGYLASLEAWMNKYEVTIEGTEETVYHDSGYAGTMDILARLKGETEPRVIDIKSGGIFTEHYFQAAAYRQALVDDGLPVGGLMVVGLGQDGTFKTLGTADPMEADIYYEGFRAAKRIWEIRNGNKLRELGYFSPGPDIHDDPDLSGRL